MQERGGKTKKGKGGEPNAIKGCRKHQWVFALPMGEMFQGEKIQKEVNPSKKGVKEQLRADGRPAS